MLSARMGKEDLLIVEKLSIADHSNWIGLRSNGEQFSRARRNKYRMGEAVRASGKSPNATLSLSYELRRKGSELSSRSFA